MTSSIACAVCNVSSVKSSLNFEFDFASWICVRNLLRASSSLATSNASRFSFLPNVLCIDSFSFAAFVLNNSLCFILYNPQKLLYVFIQKAAKCSASDLAFIALNLASSYLVHIISAFSSSFALQAL